METKTVPFHLYNTHLEAIEAIQGLDKAGFDVDKLSLVGKGYHGEEHPMGIYGQGDRIKTWGGIGAAWGGLWGLLFAPAMFFVPGLGLLAMARPVVTALITALEGAVVVGGLSAIGAALTELGFSHGHAIQYEAAVNAKRYVLLVHGSAEEIAKANTLLGGSTTWLVALVAAGGLLMAAPIADAAQGSRLYAPCAACHTAEAWGSADGTVPSLAGQRRQYLEEQIALFQSGARVDPAMQNAVVHTALKNRQDIAELAQYLAALPVNPQPVKGRGDQLPAGRDVNDRICAGCHSTSNRGNPDSRAPRIVGQQYPYLRRQIAEGADLHADFAPPEMTGALRGMTRADQDAVADYLSRFGDAADLADAGPSADKRGVARH